MMRRVSDTLRSAIVVLVALVAIGVGLSLGRQRAGNLALTPEQGWREDASLVLLLPSLDLLANDLGPEVRGVVIEAAELIEAPSETIDRLVASVQRGLPVFAIGERVFPGLLAEQLGIVAAQTAMPGDYSQLLADGLCLQPGGLYQTITLAAPSGWMAPPDRLLQDISAAIDAFTQGSWLHASPLAYNTEQWTLVGIATHLFDASGLGTYASSVACYQLNAGLDGDERADYWHLLLQYTAQPGNQPFTSARSALEPGLGHAVVEYGASEAEAVGSHRQTKLINRSAPSAPRIEHQLELGSTKRTSHVGFAWSQTVTLATQEGEQMLPLILANSLRFAWPGDEFLDEMACRFSR